VPVVGVAEQMGMEMMIETEEAREMVMAQIPLP